MDIDKEAQETVREILKRSTPNLMTKAQAKDFYEQIISDLEMYLDGLAHDADL